MDTYKTSVLNNLIFQLNVICFNSYKINLKQILSSEIIRLITWGKALLNWCIYLHFFYLSY